MFFRSDLISGEKNSGVVHPEHEKRNTRVSEYLRKYGQGKIDSLPTDTRPVVNDSRTTDEMMSDDGIIPSLGTDELDVMCELSKNKERFEAAFSEIELTKSQKEKFEAALKVLDDKNASYEQKSDAMRILEELEQKGKVKRVRD